QIKMKKKKIEIYSGLTSFKISYDRKIKFLKFEDYFQLTGEQALKQGGANVDWYFLSCLENNNNVLARKIFSMHKDYDYFNSASFKMLQPICKCNDFNLLYDFLLNVNGGINFQDECKKTALEYACEYNNLKLVKFLIKEGAAIGPFIFHRACQYGSIELVNFLFPYIKNINIIDQYGRTPIDHACANSKEDIILSLLKHYDKNNILKQLCLTENSSVIIELFNKETFDINTVDQQGKTLFNYMLALGNSSALHVIIKLFLTKNKYIDVCENHISKQSELTFYQGLLKQYPNSFRNIVIDRRFSLYDTVFIVVNVFIVMYLGFLRNIF
ncbi:MAG TPA: ankyrin repeat domain-containing protein, partial [Candidatus Babeliales bacterium]|nr:ankyrin repeat domain-containing protein [Candidatus Babeliales bacterium]